MYFIFYHSYKRIFANEVIIILINTNKQKGNSGLGIAIAYFSLNEYTVSIPLNDTQDYDIIVEKNNIIKTVQVKFTSCKTKNNSFQVALQSCGGTKGKRYKTFIDTNVDYLFISNENLELYLIPKEFIFNKTTLNLCSKYSKFQVYF
ncbi:MAG: hypothetical protein KIC60_02735 [Clostridium sp.]|nr:hypothetical protein [Clostridium sp.]